MYNKLQNHTADTVINHIFGSFCVCFCIDLFYIYIYCRNFNAEFNKLIKTVGHLAVIFEK